MTEAPKSNKALPKDKRIIVLEDDDGIRDMIRMSLEAEGFSVKVARDGRDILSLANQFNPDLVISDVMMPGGGGYEVLRNLQSDQTLRQVPVIMISGYAFDASTKKMMEQEPNVKGFLEKPIRPTQFITKIHELLKTKSRDEQIIEQSQSNREIDINRLDF